MAFNTAKTTATTSTAPANGREPRTTIGFVNLYIPLEDGTKKKVGNDIAIRLYAENPAHADLVELIKQHGLDPEEAGQALQVEIALHEPVDPDAERPMPAFFANRMKQGN